MGRLAQAVRNALKRRLCADGSRSLNAPAEPTSKGRRKKTAANQFGQVGIDEEARVRTKFLQMCALAAAVRSEHANRRCRQHSVWANARIHLIMAIACVGSASLAFIA